MKAVIVRYEVRPGFAEENRANIQAVLAEHREHALPGVRYTVWTEDDTTFVHLGLYADLAAIDAAVVPDVPGGAAGIGPRPPSEAHLARADRAGFPLFDQPPA